MNKRTKNLVLLFLGLIPLVSSVCNEEKSNRTICSFKYVCKMIISDLNLPPRCKASFNDGVTVDVTLRDAIDVDDTAFMDLNSLRYVTSIRIIANWPQTNLAIIQNMPSLQNLYLIDDKISKIGDKAFYLQTDLEIIDLSHNNLSDIEHLFQFNGINNLKRLSLAHNQIRELTVETFAELNSLISLDLSDNFISDLTEEPFANLTSLQELRLNNNKIKDLNGAVSNLINLKYLYLRGNQIQNIDEPSLNVIFHLKTFDLSDNQLNKLRPNVLLRHWSHFKGVCKIFLAKNSITSVLNASSLSSRYFDQTPSFSVETIDLMKPEPWMSKFKYTRDLNINKVDVSTEIDLSNNAIDEIQYNAFFSLAKLTYLDLSRNNLTIFHVNPEHMKFVTYLNLRSNQLQVLKYESFSSMTDLEHIDLSENKLNFIQDDTFFANKHLRTVLMAFNKFDKLTTLFFETFDTAGGALDLSGNQISKLDVPIGEAKKLTSLILSSNKICDLNDIKLSYLYDLKTLLLDRNCIKKLNNSLINLPKDLQILDLSYNEIDIISPSTFIHLRELQKLNLAHNKLQYVDYGALEGLYALSRLDLSFNKITDLDTKVLMNLNNLQELSLSNNGLHRLNYNIWLGHRNVLRVFLEGNNFSCDWLALAIKDYQNGFSKMKPSVSFREENVGPSVGNIPCVQKEKKLDRIEIFDTKKDVLIDERLLNVNKKVLESLREQTHYLRSIFRILDKQFNKNFTVQSLI